MVEATQGISSASGCTNRPRTGMRNPPRASVRRVSTRETPSVAADDRQRGDVVRIALQPVSNDVAKVRSPRSARKCQCARVGMR
jgi:hypothetical protein